MHAQMTSFTALWKVIKTHLSLEHHMKTGMGMEVDAVKHHPNIFHILTIKMH
jgi:hypothetical protein